MPGTESRRAAFTTLEVSRGKPVRIRRLSPLLAAGRLRFKRGSPGTQLLVNQKRDFPVDAPEGLFYAKQRGSPSCKIRLRIAHNAAASWTLARTHMAREEQDREDLLAEATALVERAELSLAGFGEPVVVGFRRDGCASVYFGADPAWHFNTQGQLRRAYVAGLLYKPEQGRLISLERRRNAGEIHLLRQELSKQQQRDLLEQLARWIDLLRRQLRAGAYRVVGQVPADGNVLGRIERWLLEFPSDVQVASAPYAF